MKGGGVLTPPIAANVKRLREAAGLSQQALATAAGLSVSIVCQIEQQKNKDPRGSTLRKLADALGVAVDELLRDQPAAGGGAGKKPRPKKGEST